MPHFEWFNFVNPLEVFAESCTFDELKALRDFMASLTEDDMNGFYEAAQRLAIAEIKENGLKISQTLNEFLTRDQHREAMYEMFEKVRERVLFELILQRFQELN